MQGEKKEITPAKKDRKYSFRKFISYVP